MANQFKKLVSNTMLFGISTFGAKLLGFFMLPVYTGILEAGAFGTVGLITTTCNFLVPVISLCIHESVIRFGMEKSLRRADIFTSSILVIFCGYAVLLLFSPLIFKIPLIPEPMWLILCFCLTSAMRSSVTHFVRASGFTRLFALDGIMTTVMTAAFSLLYMVGFKMGVTGYVLGIVSADAFSALSLIIALKLYRFFKPKRLEKQALARMLHYCVPLMPTAVFWAVTNLSDRYFIEAMVGSEANGMYNAAAHIPSMITIVSAVFIQAWQISAFDEYDGNPRNASRFYSTVYRGYTTLVFLAASAIILLAKPLIVILTSRPEYHEGWRYVPFLVLAITFSCFVTFLGTIYNAAKKNAMVTVTTFVGAAINLILNALLIPSYGPTGAAFATFISYFVVFVIRAVDSQRYIRIAMQPVKLVMILALLLLQCWVALHEVRYWVMWELVIFVALVLCNLGNLVFLTKNAMRIFFPSKDRS